MRAINTRNGLEIANKVEIAKGIFKRLKGLLGRDSIAKGFALLIYPCNSIHTFAMKFPIDVIFLDRNHKVIAIKKSLKPNRLTKIYLKASSVLELPEGTIEDTSTNIGDTIKFID